MPSSQADDQPQRVRKRRRQSSEPKGWKAIPKPVLIIIPTCLLLVVLIPLASTRGWVSRRPVTAQNGSNASARSTGDLRLVNASLDRSSMTIKGTVVNRSISDYDDVQIAFNVNDSSNKYLATILATIPHIRPRQTVPFESDPAPQETLGFQLKEILGVAR